MNLRDIPNTISVLRMVLVVPVAWFLLTQRYTEALLTFLVAGISDGVDGYLAKRFGWRSRLGSILDPLADKLLLVTTYMVLGWLAVLPLWLVITVVVRDVVLFSGALAFHWLVGRYDMEPSWISKFNTVAQIVLAVAAVASLDLLPMLAGIVEGLIYVVLITTLLSGADYVWTWGVRAYRARRAPR